MRRIAIGFLKKYRSELLLCAFLAQLLASPLAESRPHLGDLFAFGVLLMVLAGASYMASRKVVNFLVIPLVCVWFVTRCLEAFGNSRHLYAHMSPVAGLAVSCAVLWGILRRFGTIPRVTSSVIAEAFISYLVIAIAFSQLYWVLSRLVANPFNQTVSISQSSTLLYFSMITLSGVGYGGIVPINPYVRLIAAFENMFGIFFIAVVVARLVSSYGSQGQLPEDSERSGTS
jgi:hypothetical protein